MGVTFIYTQEKHSFSARLNYFCRAKLTKKVIESWVLDRVKQELYESFKFDAETSAENLNAMGQRVGKLERANDALRDELDAQEQYSRRNCLLLHGVPETEADTTAAALHIIDQHLDIKLPSDAIDRSHRLGRRGLLQPEM